MNRQISSVLFDLDGTLVDSIADISAAVNRALGRLNAPPVEDEVVRSMVGWGLPELARLVASHLGENQENVRISADEMTKLLIEEYDRIPFEHATVYPGIHELLDTLSAAGIRYAVCTNKREEVAKTVVGALFGDNRFEVVAGQRQDRPVKPDFEAVRVCLDALGARAYNAVFVGDSDIDVQTAHNAGMPAIGAAWGFRDREHLHEAGADVICETPSDLLDYFSRTVIPSPA